MTTEPISHSSPQTAAELGEQRPRVIIRSSRGWRSLDLRQVWLYRELLWFLTLRDVKSRYRQTAFGPLWFVIKPLINMVIFTVIFGRVAKLSSEGVPYAVFTYTALIPWTYFQAGTTMAVGSLVTLMNIISKVYLPRLLVPISAVVSNLVDMGLSFIILVGMLAFYRITPTVGVFFLPFYLLLAAMTSLALGLWGATLAVRYRDVVLSTSFLLQAVMFFTPVAYSATEMPASLLLINHFNPMFWVVEGFRWALLGTGSPPSLIMVVPVIGVLVLLVTGAYVFTRTERSIVDLL